MKTAAESRVAVVTQLMLETEASRSFWMRPRIGMGRGLHHRHDHGGDAQREDDDRFVSVAGSSRGVAWFTSGGSPSHRLTSSSISIEGKPR